MKTRASSLRLCHACGNTPVTADRATSRAEVHPNAKYCAACRAARRRQPPSTLTPEQGAVVARLTGQMTRTALATRLGVSRAAVTRYVREHRLYGRSDAYPPEVVAAVLTAYESAPKGAGKQRVQEQFPDVCVRSIVERHKPRSPRQRRWTAAQLLDAARMAGLVSPNAQARYFGRPNAYNGSIRALWVKRFRCPAHDVNSLPGHLAWALCGPGTPAILVGHPTNAGAQARVLWIDLLPALYANVPPLIRQAVDALAQFQRWLHHGASRESILQMIIRRERSTCDVDSRHHDDQ